MSTKSTADQILSEEVIRAIHRTLYHYPGMTPNVFLLILGGRVSVPQPKPTEEEKKMAEKVVKELVSDYSKSMRVALQEVTGEEIPEIFPED